MSGSIKMIKTGDPETAEFQIAEGMWSDLP
jgi:hypothetical protein